MFSLDYKKADLPVNREASDNLVTDIANSIITTGWSSDSFMTVVEGTKGKSLVAEQLEIVLKAEKKYPLITGLAEDGSAIVENFTGEVITAKVKALNLEGGQVVTSGTNRLCGWAIAKAYLPEVDIIPLIVECSKDEAYEKHVQGNADHDRAKRLNASEKLPAVIRGIEKGIYKQETNLPFARGTQQKLWAQARLVLQGIPNDQAVKLGKEDARKAADSEDSQAYVTKVLEGATTKPEAIMKTGDIRKLHELATTKKLEGAAVKLLEYIIEKNTIMAEALLISECSPKAEAPEAPAEPVNA